MEKSDDTNYYQRRAEEAVGVVVECEVRVAAARMLAINPDAEEGAFLDVARQAWREVEATVARRSATVPVVAHAVPVAEGEVPR